MIPSIELIKGMRLAADKLEDEDYDYNHGNYESCLLGTLTQVTSNLSEHDIFEEMNNDHGVVGYYAHSFKNVSYCPVTNLPMNSIYRHLHQLGLTKFEDLLDIEFVSKFHIKGEKSPTRQEAIEYFRRKADELETQLLSNLVVKVNNIVVQSVGV